MRFLFATSLDCHGCSPRQARYPQDHVIEVTTALDPDDGDAYVTGVMLLVREGGRGRPRDITSFVAARPALERELRFEAIDEYVRDGQARRYAAHDRF